MNFLFIHNRKKKPQPNRNLSPKLLLSSSNMKCMFGLWYILLCFNGKGIPVKNVICLILKRNK